MPTLIDSSLEQTDIQDWILRQATATDDGEALIAGVGRRLNAAGVPVWRLSIGVPSIDPAHRGISVRWHRDGETSIASVAHGAEGDAEFARSPIGMLLAEGRDIGRWNVAAGEGCGGLPMLAEFRRQGGTDYVLHIIGFAPGTAVVGAGISFVTDRPGGFSDGDLARIAGLLPAIGLATLRLCLSKTLRGLLGAYVGPRTGDRVLSGRIRRGQGEIMAGAILLVDLKGFTAATDHEDPLRVVGWLDEHLEALGEDVSRNDGEILKFTGDGFLAVFPVFVPEALPCAVCGRALDAARAGLARNRALAERRAARDEPGLAADLALHFGDVVYGNIGTASRLDFTAIGRAVNEASRIETLCDATGRNILVSDSFARRCAEPLVALGEFSLRGVGTPQRLWTVPDE